MLSTSGQNHDISCPAVHSQVCFMNSIAITGGKNEEVCGLEVGILGNPRKNAIMNLTSYFMPRTFYLLTILPLGAVIMLRVCWK